MWEDEDGAAPYPGLSIWTGEIRRSGALVDIDALQSDVGLYPWQEEVAVKINTMIQKQMDNMILDSDGNITTKEQEEARKMRDNRLFASF